MIEIDKSLLAFKYYVDDQGVKRRRFGARTAPISWLVVHYTGTRKIQGRAKKMAKKARYWKRTVSSHYYVGDDGIFQSVLDENRAYHCGGYCKTNKCVACNNVAIGVDLVEHKDDTKSGSVKDRDWWFSDETLRRGAELIACLADKYNIPNSHIIRHYDVTGKVCPRPFVGTDVNSHTGETGEFAWLSFHLLIESKRKQIIC